MKTRARKLASGGRTARSVLECGGPPPLSLSLQGRARHSVRAWDKSSSTLRRARSDAPYPHSQSARGLAQSKTWRQFVVLLISVFSFQLSAFAQSYSIDWFTIDGGGGTSTGGVYSVSGTIGQPDAGPTMSGGNYSVDGGFWPIIAAVQTPGAPMLTVTLTTTNTAIVSWLYPSSGFALQQNTNLNTTNWVVPAQTVTNNGAINYIIVNPPSANRFYRLFKP